MKERPILFSGPMVRAILDGRKTQTRRIVKPQPIGLWGSTGKVYGHTFSGVIEGPKDNYWVCPYGQAGDRLWVRESYFQFGHWEEVPGVKTKSGRTKWRFVADSDAIQFHAPESFRKGRHHKDSATPAWHKRLGRFMPRTASGITLEITGIRVERLHDITEEDAIAEGIDNDFDDKTAAKFSIPGPVYRFQALWESINGPGSWETNPWVWVLEFKRFNNG